MIGKTLIAAAVLAVAAAGTATTASAHPSHGYKRVVTVQQCIGGGKYLVRKSRRTGRVYSKTRIGRCHNAHRHHAHHHHHHAKNRKAKRIVKRIFRRAFNN